MRGVLQDFRSADLELRAPYQALPRLLGPYTSLHGQRSQNPFRIIQGWDLLMLQGV